MQTISTDGPRLSFVIPAFNEARNIPRTLASIQRHAGAYVRDVVVVDNGSTDATAELAHAAGAHVLQRRGGTIAALRNLGERHVQGDILIFLDADVSLTDDWRAAIGLALERLNQDPPVVTGSHCGPPDDGGWIERNWFKELARLRDTAHLGTGHMIVTRGLFQRLGGFDEALETGEDYDFCQRARAAGATIINNPALRVVHHDFPKNLAAFIRREAWHGRGDLQSWRAFLNSRVALAAGVFALAHLIILLGVLLPAVRPALLVGVLLLSALMAASTWHKYRHAPWRTRWVNGALFYFYYLGRALAFMHVFHRRRRRPA